MQNAPLPRMQPTLQITQKEFSDTIRKLLESTAKKFDIALDPFIRGKEYKRGVWTWRNSTDDLVVNLHYGTGGLRNRRIETVGLTEGTKTEEEIKAELGSAIRQLQDEMAATDAPYDAMLAAVTGKKAAKKARKKGSDQ